MKRSPIAKAEMLIRKPVAEVFEAFVNPAITSKFGGEIHEHTTSWKQCLSNTRRDANGVK